MRYLFAYRTSDFRLELTKWLEVEIVMRLSAKRRGDERQNLPYPYRHKGPIGSERHGILTVQLDSASTTDGRAGVGYGEGGGRGIGLM